MRVHDIMMQPVYTCTVDMLATASRLMRDTGCGTLLVLNHRGRLAGIVTDRDLALAFGEIGDSAPSTVKDVMSHPVRICRPNDDLRLVLHKMGALKVRRLPVVSEGGAITGVISIDDIILWGVHDSGVSLHELVAALRSICVSSTAALQASAEP
jgi:CBS domain-containing protein